jgi:hypothetical protein
MDKERILEDGRLEITKNGHKNAGRHRCLPATPNPNLLSHPFLPEAENYAGGSRPENTPHQLDGQQHQQAGQNRF